LQDKRVHFSPEPNYGPKTKPTFYFHCFHTLWRLQLIMYGFPPSGWAWKACQCTPQAQPRSLLCFHFQFCRQLQAGGFIGRRKAWAVTWLCFAFQARNVSSSQGLHGLSAKSPRLVACVGQSEPTEVTGVFLCRPMGSKPGFSNQPLCITPCLSP